MDRHDAGSIRIMETDSNCTHLVRFEDLLQNQTKPFQRYVTSVSLPTDNTFKNMHDRRCIPCQQETI